MIHFVGRFDNQRPLVRLLRSVAPDFRTGRALTYEELFRTRRAPAGHYVFTDHDWLSAREFEAASAIAAALREAHPDARILNPPGQVLERYALLNLLDRQGLNDFSILRLDEGRRPSRYPVFLRAEDDHRGVGTDLLHDDAAFDAAIAQLQRAGKSLKHHVAIGFCGQTTSDGYYRKYGAFRIGGEVIGQHVLESRHWMVKSSGRVPSEAVVVDELAYVRGVPHRAQLDRVFELAGIDYGRVDYGVVDGRVQVYEINTNPFLPRMRPDARDARRPGAIGELRRQRAEWIRARTLDALRAIDTPLASQASVRFALPSPRLPRVRTHTPMVCRVHHAWLSFAERYAMLERRWPGLAERSPVRAWLQRVRRSA